MREVLVLILLLLIPVQVQAELSITYRLMGSGNEEGILQNKGDDKIDIYLIIGNRKPNRKVCVLKPTSSEYGNSILRSDIDFVKEGWGRKYLEKVTLEFGDTIEFVWPKACGGMLELRIKTSEGDKIFSTN